MFDLRNLSFSECVETGIDDSEDDAHEATFAFLQSTDLLRSDRAAILDVVHSNGRRRHVVSEIWSFQVARASKLARSGDVRKAVETHGHVLQMMNALSTNEHFMPRTATTGVMQDLVGSNSLLFSDEERETIEQLDTAMRLKKCWRKKGTEGSSQRSFHFA
ncbi:MAG: hypothetical protein R3C05_20495 [Pirellulaceae bacterium]